MGVPQWALAAAAAFAKKRVGAHAFVYVNECDRPFQPSLHYNGSFVNGPGGSPGPGIPDGLDMISMDIYCPNQAPGSPDHHVPSKPSPKPLPGVPPCSPLDDYTKAALEPAVAKAFYDRYIFPLLKPHQAVGIIPGTFGNETQTVAEQDPFVTAKMSGYWEWAQNESRIELINPWHWARVKTHGTEGDVQYGRGAVEFPKLLAKIQEIGAAIMKRGDGRREDHPTTIQGAITLPAGPTLSIVGPGSTAADPTYGSTATIVVASDSDGSALVPRSRRPWIRLDRPDGVAETGTGSDGDNSGLGWMTIADEMASFESALAFPVWMRPDWGPFRLFFGGAANNRSVEVVASGWSTNGPNATQLTENSSVLTIHYSTACRQAKAVMEAVSLGPGKVRLSVSNLKTDTLAASCPVTQTAFFAYTPSSKSPGMFDYLYPARVESDRNFSHVFGWAHPGIYYYGAAPSSRGRMMSLTAGGEYNTVLGTHPMALVVATADGRVFNATGGIDGATIPPGFKGEVVHVIPLPQVSDSSSASTCAD
jgi:hypothetical protein